MTHKSTGPSADPYVNYFWRSQEPGTPDLYAYDLPSLLQVRLIAHIKTGLERVSRASREAADQVESHLGYENSYENNMSDEGFLYSLLRDDDVRVVLGVLEIICRSLEKSFARNRTNEQGFFSALNALFDQHAAGYQYENGLILKRDSQFVHSSVTRPLLRLLSNDAKFAGANQEFLKAHKCYRSQDYSGCLVECGKALESLLKAVCDSRGWAYASGKATASTLINVVLQQGLIPQNLQTHFSGIRNTLDAGVPTIRNQAGGAHGQGATAIQVPHSLATYQIHLTAAVLLFLAQADSELP